MLSGNIPARPYVLLLVFIFILHGNVAAQTLSIFPDGPHVRVTLTEGGRRAYHMQSSTDLRRWVDLGAPFTLDGNAHETNVQVQGISNFFRVVDNGAVIDDINSQEWLQVDPVSVSPQSNISERVKALAA